MTDTKPTSALNITDIVSDGPIPPRVVNASWPNVLHTRISDIVAKKGPAPWSGNRPHWHRDFDEWWVVMAGQLEWELTGGTVVKAQKDDIVWVPRGTVHHIRAVGDEMTLRLAVAMPPAIHVYHDCEQCGFHQDGPAEWGA